MHYSTNQLTGAELIFLLELDWHGQKHYFSTRPITLGEIQYKGTLGDFRYGTSTTLSGANLEQNSLSLQVYFDGLDLVQEWRRGRTLEGARGIFGYVISKPDIEPDTDNQVILLDGLVQLPIIGDPEEPPSAAAFTLERQPYESSIQIIKQSQVIDERTFPIHDQDTAGGKLYPMIIGTPGTTLDDDGNSITIYATPAYNVERYTAVSHPETYFLISGHEVLASSVHVRDGAGNTSSFSVLKGFDGRGQVFSYVNLQGSSLMYPHNASIATNAESPDEFWVAWTNGGGLANPFGEGALSGGADVCRWALAKAGLLVDYGAWDNIAGILNQYRFDGYINEPVGAWDWLKNNILPYLPIEIIGGPKGVKPVLAQIFAYTNVRPVMSIEGNADFSRISAIETLTETSELINSIQIRYAKQGQEDKYAMSFEIAPQVEQEGDAQRTDMYSAASQNRYGTQQETFETDYVYNRSTAARISATMIKSYSFPMRTIRFSAAVQFGALSIGDVVELTDESLYFDNVRCTVISKSWNFDTWTIELSIIDNPLLNDRYF